MITGFPSIQGAVEAVKAGADEYLAKPFTNEELIRAVHKALRGRVGVYLDNLRTDPISRASWLALIRQVRKLCGEDIPVVVAAGWQTQNLDWIAPEVNGISYEDAVHHKTNADTEAFYGRIRRWERMFRRPRLGMNEVFGKRADVETMRRELIRTLVYTDMAYLYADSNRDFAHEWRPEWDIPLGRAKDASPAPAKGALARRAFAGGIVLWLPSSAKKPATIDLDEPMRKGFDGAEVRRCTLQPGTGTILLRLSGQRGAKKIVPATNSTSTQESGASEPAESKPTGD